MILFARRGRAPIVPLLVATLVACGPDAPVESGPSSSASTGDATGGAGSTGGTSSTGSTAPDGSTVTPTSNDTTTGDGLTCATDCGGDRTSFIDDGSDPTPFECDPFVPMCPDDQKCAALKGGSSNWNTTMCVPLTGSKKPGEPCLAEDGGSTGIDDCEKGAMCWDVDDLGNGVCVEVCFGSEEAPMCSDPAAGCAIVSEGVLNICLDTCDPLVQDCAGDDVCLPASSTYLCVATIPDPEAVFGPCDVANGCEEGLLCLNPQAASECDQRADGCCSPLCSIADGPPCPGLGQQCLTVYEPPPPGFEDVGYCSVPG